MGPETLESPSHDTHFRERLYPDNKCRCVLTGYSELIFVTLSTVINTHTHTHRKKERVCECDVIFPVIISIHMPQVHHVSESVYHKCVCVCVFGRNCTERERHIKRCRMCPLVARKPPRQTHTVKKYFHNL